MQCMKPLVIIGLVVLLPGTVFAQANLEGPTGACLNPLSYTLPEGTVQGSVHFVDMQPMGTLTTVGVTAGLPGGLEIGITREAFAVGGTTSTDLIHGKWAVLPEKENVPAVSLGAVVRRPHGSGKSTADFYIVGTKINSFLECH